MEKILRYVLSNFTLTFSVVGLLCFLSNWVLNPAYDWRELFFVWFLIVPLGIGSLYAGICHIFFPNISAKSIGWKPHPFQVEVGIANLSYGTIAILSAFWGYEARLITICGLTIFLWGAAMGHIRDMVANSNFAPGNAGVIFWTDLLFPMIGIVLLTVTRSG